ncbi:MAG TPA: hypothetical protein VNG33_01145, partial [Polyangiaceae bacterium]|nr:hypothetical protein [Polyangiaceae bacterium]
GATDHAERVKSTRSAFQQQLVSDYAGLRLRLQLALAQGHQRDARQEVEALETLVFRLGGTPYRAWLQSVKLGLDARLGSH